uniref:Uncharacterized protein n=1 Tax=Arundo donax TaxID=35708 RepID=A0A0A8XQP2_ARUDO
MFRGLHGFFDGFFFLTR